MATAAAGKARRRTGTSGWSRVSVLAGGTRAWVNAGFAQETGPGRLASQSIDRYRRPYEGTNNPREAMQAYLDWEFVNK